MRLYSFAAAALLAFAFAGGTNDQVASKRELPVAEPTTAAAGASKPVIPAK